MKKLFFLLVALLACGISAIVWFNLQWATQPSFAQINRAEAALAKRNLVALAYIDHTNLATFTKSNQDIQQALAEQQNDALASLYRDHLQDNLKQAVFALTVDKEPTFYGLLSGTFSQQVIRAALAQDFVIESLNQNLIKISEQPKKQPDFLAYACPDDLAEQQAMAKMTEPKSAYMLFSPDWLVISNSPTAASEILQDLGAAADTSPLSPSWQQFKQGKFAALALFNPENTAGSVNGMAAFMAQMAQQQNPEVSTVYLGTGINLVKQGLDISGQIQATPQWAASRGAMANMALQSQVTSLETLSPVLANIVKGISIEAVAEQLTVQLTLGKQEIEAIPEIAGQMTANMFGGSSLSDEEPMEESIDENPWDFQQNQALANLPAFAANNFTGTPGWVQDEFALGLENLAYGKMSQTLELSIKAMMEVPEIDGFWSDSQGELKLYNIDVQDKNGNTLVKDERCDNEVWDKNQKPTQGFLTHNSHATLTKTLRLIEQADMEQIARITGNIAFSAPVNIQAFDLEYKTGASVTADGVTLSLADTKTQHFKTKATGDNEKIVEIRAFNASGQALSFYSSSGFEDSKTYYFRGNIARLQVFIAKERINKEVEFDVAFENLMLADKPDGYGIERLPAAITQDAIAPALAFDKSWITRERIAQRFFLSADTPIVADHTASPVAMFVSHNLKSSWNYQPKLLAAIPVIDALAFNLQAYEIELNGEKRYLSNRPNFVIADGKVGRLGSSFNEGNDKFYTSEIKLPVEVAEGEQLTELSGNLHIHLPTAITQSEIALPSMTKPTEIAGISLTLNSISNGFMPTVVVQASGERLVGVFANTATGLRLPQKSEWVDGAWQIQFALAPKIEGLVVLTADSLDTLSYPVTLTPNYP